MVRKQSFFKLNFNKIYEGELIMSENDTEKKEKVFCIFNNDKENINMQIEKSFIAYLKNSIKDDKEP